jgi:hypothetical protein
MTPRQEAAALPAYDRSGSNSTELTEATRPSMSAVPPIPTVSSMRRCLSRCANRVLTRRTRRYFEHPSGGNSLPGHAARKWSCYDVCPGLHFP